MLDLIPHAWRAIKHAAALGSVSLLLAACLAGTETASRDEEPVYTLYSDAMGLLEQGEFKKAAEAFDEVERQHPYSVWATKAQLMSAFAYYEKGRYDEAIIALDRFIQLHPGNRDVSYAYYLKALCYYEQITDVERDQQVTELALQSLDDVITRFPDSKYARDALIKIDLARDHLAGKEMTIGRFYQRRGNYLAAINRYRNVVEQFQTTSHIPEALHRLTESYLALGLPNEARASAAVLGHNFPSSSWYSDSYALLAKSQLEPARDERSWIDKIFGS